MRRFLLACLLALLPWAATAETTELNFVDFNSQSPFNRFSGDNGTFGSHGGFVSAAFDSEVFHGRDGASLRMDYSVQSGFCGLWHSLLGKASYSRYTLNFTNLYGPLKNSAGNPSRVESVRVTNFSFWARGDGKGDFSHEIKVEFKDVSNLLGSAVFKIPNGTDWMRFDYALDSLETNDVSHMKEVVFVLEDWRNEHRSGRLYLDDLRFTTDEPHYDATRLSDDAMLDLICQRAFAYFMNFTDDLGFALDRSTYSDMVSVGTIGFQLTAYCIGHQRGWADRADLERRVENVLQNLKDIPIGPDAGTSRGGYRGFYYHFLNANTGTRKDGHVELSLYDTTLLMYGVLSCKEYFTTNARIQTLSQELFDRVEWDWFVDHAPGPNHNQFYLAWQPENLPVLGELSRPASTEGRFFKHVDGQTDEAMMTDVLALGSTTHPVSFDTYLARNRVFGSYPPGSGRNIMVSWRGSMFNYFFGSCWLDFRKRGVDLDPKSPRDLWQNDKLAILANRDFCLAHAGSSATGRDHYVTYGEGAWGLTACDNLVPPEFGVPGEYFAFGALPSEENIRFGTRALQVGTIATYGAAGSINFAPEAALTALRHDFRIPDLWSPFLGLGDAYSLDPHYITGPYDTHGNPTIHKADYLNGPWVNSMLMGVNLGPMLLAIENYRSQSVWSLTAGNPEISVGMDRIFGLGSPCRSTISIEQKGDQNNVNLTWGRELGASAYNIYGSTNLISWKLLQNGLKSTSWSDNTLAQGPPQFYRVKALR